MTQGPAENPRREPGPEFKEPQHPDFAILDKVILAHLIVAPSDDETPREQIEALVGETVDPQSAMFSAIARAMAFLNIENGVEMAARMDEVVRYAIFWTEGLTTGVHFERERSSTPEKRDS